MNHHLGSDPNSDGDAPAVMRRVPVLAEMYGVSEDWLRKQPIRRYRGGRKLVLMRVSDVEGFMATIKEDPTTDRSV